MKITQEEFDEWKQNKITQEVLKFFLREAEVRRQMAGNIDLNKSLQERAELSFKLTYGAVFFENLTEISLEDIQDDESDSSRT